MTSVADAVPYSPSLRLWLALPGLACPPSDFDEIALLLSPAGVRVRTLDQWRVPLTAAPRAIHTELGSPRARVGLIGHSLGALTALRLALAAAPGGELADDIEVGAIVLLDPTTPAGPTPPWARILGRFAPEPRYPIRPRPGPLRAGLTFPHRAMSGQAGSGPAASRWTEPEPGPTGRASMGRTGMGPNRARQIAQRVTAPGGWAIVVRQLSESWDLAHEVTLAVRNTSVRLAPSLAQLTGMRGSAAFLRDQRRFAAMVGAHLSGLRGCGHTIPTQRPAIVARTLRRLGGSTSTTRSPMHHDPPASTACAFPNAAIT